MSFVYIFTQKDFMWAKTLILNAKILKEEKKKKKKENLKILVRLEDDKLIIFYVALGHGKLIFCLASARAQMFFIAHQSYLLRKIVHRQVFSPLIVFTAWPTVWRSIVRISSFYNYISIWLWFFIVDDNLSFVW